MLDSRRWLLISLVLCLLCQGAWAQSSIAGIRLGQHGQATRIVLDLSAASPYRIGLLASPARLYIELPPAPMPASLPRGLGLVTRLAESRDHELMRVIAYLGGPARISRADQIFGTAGDASRRLVVEVSPASDAEFAAALDSGPVDSTPPITLAGPEAAPSAAVASDPANAAPATGTAAAMSAALPAASPTGPLPMLRPSAEAPPSTAPEPPAPAVSAGVPQLRPASSSTGAFQAAAVAALPAAPAGAGMAATPVALAWPATVPMLRPGGAPTILPLIFIDPGHGGSDPGTVGQDGVYEKDVTLAMALELQRQLIASGRYRVKLTRIRDQFVPLRPRFEMARAEHADMFISLHADSSPFFNARGATVYTLSETASDAEAEALATKENKADLIDGVDLSRQNTAVTSILIDLAQRETKNRSAAFAELLVEDMARATRMLRNSHRFAGFAVLKAPDIPSVLIELGYLSDPQDEALLISAAHRAKLAGAMLRAIDGYYAEVASGTRS
jgi:N-acetylmuramoyl-L-alanine amidase